MKKNDIKYMSLSLDLAKKGINTCMPNPRVGCVIVKDDKVIGQTLSKYEELMPKMKKYLL